MPKQTYFNLSEDKKERIRSAVIKLFCTLPYEDVTTRLLASESGISKGSLYQYFDSKDEMYIYYIDLIYTELVQAGIWNDQFLKDPGTHEAEKAFIDSLFHAPANVLLQYYFSTRTISYRLNYEKTAAKVASGEISENINVGLLQFLNAGMSLIDKMYARAINIDSADQQRRFMEDNMVTHIHFHKTMSRLYSEEYEAHLAGKDPAQNESAAGINTANSGGFLLPEI